MIRPVTRPVTQPTWLLASDLDRTLIYSGRAMRLGEPVPEPVCVEHHQGKPTSFVSPVALARLVVLSRQAPFVPVTTRTCAQYARVRLPGVRVRHAVAANGAALLVDGRRCPDWDAQVAQNLAGSAAYAEGRAALAPVLDRPWVRKVRDADEHFVYAVFERGRVDRDWFAELAEAGRALGWLLSVQGRKAYLIPEPLTKEAAVAEVAARSGMTRVAAAGDSLLDRGLLEHADLAVRPAHGELHDAGWEPPGLRVTRQAGGRAAEEIVEVLAGALEG